MQDNPCYILLVTRNNFKSRERKSHLLLHSPHLLWNWIVLAKLVLYWYIVTTMRINKVEWRSAVTGGVHVESTLGVADISKLSQLLKEYVSTRLSSVFLPSKQRKPSIILYPLYFIALIKSCQVAFMRICGYLYFENSCVFLVRYSCLEVFSENVHVVPFINHYLSLCVVIFWTSISEAFSYFSCEEKLSIFTYLLSSFED